MKFLLLATALLLAFPLAATASGTPGAPDPGAAGMVRIAGGSFRPLYRQPGEAVAVVAPFLLDARPVTRGEFEAFVQAHPRWQRDRAARLFVDENYLRDWAGPASAGSEVHRDLPVTDVSWFAAKSYCEARGARLPTTNEWEYVARADEHDRNAAARAGFRQRALELALGRRLQPVGTFRNAWGLTDLHGNIMEWVSDFGSVFAGSDSRATSKLDRQLTCASGVTSTGSAGDYAAFLRYALRGTVAARSTTGTLGFRCAMSLS